jgi:uncharacterized protein YvpB
MKTNKKQTTKQIKAQEITKFYYERLNKQIKAQEIRDSFVIGMRQGCQIVALIVFVIVAYFIIRVML